MRLLLITGLPGTGKTTLARQLAQRYGVPVFGKDLIKEQLLNVLGAGDAAHSRRLSDASFAALFSVIAQLRVSGTCAVVEGNFRPGEHETALAGLIPEGFAQVLCRVPESERIARLAARREDGSRHPGHGDTSAVALADVQSDAFLELPGRRFLLEGLNKDPQLIDKTLEITKWWASSSAD